jgi:hypothetical protein
MGVPGSAWEAQPYLLDMEGKRDCGLRRPLLQ